MRKIKVWCGPCNYDFEIESMGMMVRCPECGGIDIYTQCGICGIGYRVVHFACPQSSAHPYMEGGDFE